MQNVIFGSGIVGLMAKFLVSGNWKVVPFSKSRFFSYNPPLDDNFIIRDKETDEAVAAFGGRVSSHFYRRFYSLDGQLIRDHDENVCDVWLQKVFDGDPPPQSLPYWSRRLVVPIYDIRANKLYEQLLNKFMPALAEESNNGEVTEIGQHYFIQGGKRIDFDHAISTIPLNVLLRLMNKDGVDLKLKPIHYLHIHSTKVDLEGANQALVVDSTLDFFKVTNIAKHHYLFYFLNELPKPGSYLLPIIGPADIVDGTTVANVIPCGPMPDLGWLDDYGIFCIGSCAQFDWCADLGSNLLRLVRYMGRGYKLQV